MKPLRNFLKKAKKGYQIIVARQMEQPQEIVSPSMQVSSPSVQISPSVQVGRVSPIQIPIKVIPQLLQQTLEMQTKLAAGQGTGITELRIEGIDISHFQTKLEEVIEPEYVQHVKKPEGPKQTLIYPLVPKNPAKGEAVMA